MINRAFTLTHTAFGRPFRHRLVGEDTNPHPATPLDVTHDSTTRSFNLAAGDPGRFKRLQPVVAKLDDAAALGLALSYAHETACGA